MNYTIKQTVSIIDIKQKFIDWDRDNFSIEALETIMDMLEDLRSEDGVIDLDIVGICCEFTEYEDLSELVRAYDHYLDEDLIYDEFDDYDEDYILDELESNIGMVVKLTNSYLVSE